LQGTSTIPSAPAPAILTSAFEILSQRLPDIQQQLGHTNNGRTAVTGANARVTHSSNQPDASPTSSLASSSSNSSYLLMNPQGTMSAEQQIQSLRKTLELERKEKKKIEKEV